MSNVKFPIETYRKGNKITKVCVEDIYKMLDKITDVVDRSYNKVLEIFADVNKNYRGFSGYYIIGTGRSKPCLNDAFDEEIGNTIAFMKAKLNANIKKHNVLCKAYNEVLTALEYIDEELAKVDDYIVKDLEGIRLHNSSYLEGIEDKLGIYEVQA